MRLTNKLFAQHLGWTFKKHWQVQGKRIPRDTGAAAELQKHGIVVKNPQDVIKAKENHERLEFSGYKTKELLEDTTHPLWKSKACYLYGDNNVLLEGVPQALLLTKSVEIKQFPKNVDNFYKNMQLPKNLEKTLQNIIMAAHILDAEQVKLPKVKLPERPAHNLPRVYGISHERKNRILISKLLEECDKLAGRSASLARKLSNDAHIKVTLSRNQDMLQFNSLADIIMTSKRAIEPTTMKYDEDLPDLYPLNCTISIPKKHVYSTETVYPLSVNYGCSNPHTIFSYFNREHVRNLHGTPVTSSQFESRTLLKAVSVAAARAQQLYGENAISETLPKPIVVQSVQTDGKTFHFGVFQLNTLMFDNAEGPKNYWFHQPQLDLFDVCNYNSGRPVLIGLNNEVFKYLYAFYNNA